MYPTERAGRSALIPHLGIWLPLVVLAAGCGGAPTPEPPTPTTSAPEVTPTEPGATPTEPGATPTEPGATPTEPGATPTEPGATPTEPGSTPTEPGATPTEPGATPTEPGATPTEPGATPTEPGATPTEPGATPTEPGATPTEPGATPTLPGATPTEPGATPTDPLPTPTEPGATPTEPGATPTEPGATPTATLPPTPTEVGPTPTDPPTPTEADPTATASPTPTEPPTPAPGVAPLAGDVIITEAQMAPRLVPDDDGEWVEIANVSGHRLNLTSVSLVVARPDGTSSSFFWGPGTTAPVLDAGEVAVLGYFSDPAVTGQVPVDFVLDARPTLRGSPLTLSLKLGAKFLDTIPWVVETWPYQEGHSLSRSSTAMTSAQSGDPANFCNAHQLIPGSTDYGSPGQPNPACGVDLDDDGYYTAADCNDGNAGVNPGAVDVPRTLTDEDCDGVTDEGPMWPLGSILVNEIMPNPNGVQDAAGEWIELVNTTNAAIDLEGWSIADEVQAHVISRSLVVEPGGFVVVGNNDNPVTNGGIPVDYKVPGIGWNNDTESVRLVGDNLTVDVVRYDPTWPTDVGQSFNLDPEHQYADDNDLVDFWCLGTTVIPTSAVDLGTPGSENIDCAVDLDLDGWTEEEDCEDLNPNVNPAQTEISDNGLDDNCDGIELETPPVLIITEIMYGTGEDPTSEWIELFNPLGIPVNLRGWKFQDNVAANAYIVPGDVIVAAYSYITVGASHSGIYAPPLDLVYGTSNSLQLGNSGDQISLFDDVGALIDYVPYGAAGSGWPGLTTRTSIQLSFDDYNNDNSLGAAWCKSTQVYTNIPTYPQYSILATPGTENSLCP